MRSLLGSLVALVALGSPAVAVLPPSYDDAPLRAVQFLDKNMGVAVGDHGVVWHTLDGGKTWDRMKSGSKASLRAVCFVDAMQGWAVGRTELSGDVGSVGVVLNTADGGLTWAEVNTTPLPGLNVVKFFDERVGIAAGDGCDANPSGLYATDDCGKTWAAIPGPRGTSWTCGHFTDLSNGMLGGVWSKLSVYTKGVQKSADVDSLGGRAVRGMTFNGRNGVAVCDGGVILTTTSGGGKWAVADTGLSADALACLDFRCVGSFGSTVWVAGRPGSVVLKSSDFGRTWETCKTGWNLPLHSMCAVSDTEVWAVGELGVILKTTDGGKKWTVQRCGGDRAAVLFAHASGRTLPADVVATVGGRDGYFAAAMSLTCADPATADPKRCMDEFRLAAAMRSAGGAGSDSTWAFPTPSHLGDGKSDDLLAWWDKKHDGMAEDRLVRHLVLALRMWAPDVVVSDLLANASGPAEQLVLTAVQKAFKMADDPKACPEQIEVLGLKPTAPKKLYAVAPEPGTDAPVKYDHTLFAKTLVNTPQGQAESAFAVLGEGLSSPATRCFKLVSHRMPGCESHAELTTGLALAEGGSARRKLHQLDLSEVELARLKGIFDSRRTLEGIIRGAETPAAAEKAMAMAADTLKKLPDDVACRTAVGLGRYLAAQGKWVAAREMFLLAVARYGTFPEAAEAVRWLGRYYASGEARRRADRENFVVMRYNGWAPVGGDGVKQASHTQAVTATDTARFTDAEAAHTWCKACLEMEARLKAFGPAYTRDPAMLLSTLSARRQLGLTGDAAEMVGTYFKTTPGAADSKPGTDLWHDCLAAERWLDNRAAVTAQPKPFALCPKVANKPYLDGKLDDDCWKELKPIETKTSEGELKGYVTKAYFVYDDEYLYFAVDCTHPDGKGLPKANARRRDDDLRGKDRVDILLDVDRDYQTYYRLQVDQRGCVAEDCSGDKTWNPKWFVAVEPTATGWTAEIAIPKSELVGGAFKTGSTWGMNVTRVVPGSGCQSWSGPATATPRPEGMGLMQLHTGNALQQLGANRFNSWQISPRIERPALSVDKKEAAQQAEGGGTKK